VRRPGLRTAAALGASLALGLALRLWGLDYGLPHPSARPDEERIVGRAFTILARGDFHPVEFSYPALMMYLEALALAIYFGIGRVLGVYQSLWDFLFAAAVTEPGLQFRICRALSAGLGAATAAIAFALGRRGYGSTKVGLLAAILVATNYLHVRDSHFATVDVGMAFFVMLSLLFAVRAADGHRKSNYLLAGVFAGLAAAAKYNGGAALFGVVAVGVRGLVFPSVEPQAPGRKTLAGRLVLAIAAAGVAFALATPYTWLEYRSTWATLVSARDVLYQLQGEIALWVHLKVTFPEGFGWPFFIASLAGVGRAFWRRRPTDLALLAFMVPFFYSAATVRWIFPRYLVPLVPPLAVLAAQACRAVLPSGKRLPAALAAFVLVVPGLWQSIRFDRLAARTDTRVLAAEWVAENLPPRSTIFLCQGYGAPAVNQDRRRPPAFDPRPIPCTADAVAEAQAGYLITHEHPYLRQYSHVPEELKSMLQRSGRPLATFDPFRAGERAKPYFFEGDAFYLPFSGLGALDRGGPLVTVWEMGEAAGAFRRD
jgi:4-amino-4-deoxy-L-arabinose transferase-like glycosyltransferase